MQQGTQEGYDRLSCPGSLGFQFHEEDLGSGAITFCLAQKVELWLIFGPFYGCFVLGPSLEEVVVEQAEGKFQVGTVFPKGNVNGRQPLVPALQYCLLQLRLPDELLRLLPSQGVYAVVDCRRSGVAAVGVEYETATAPALRACALRVEGGIGARATNDIVSLQK